jgi:AraC-like DNA-binding protein
MRIGSLLYRLQRILASVVRTYHNDNAMNSIQSSETAPPDPLSDVLSLLGVQSFLSRRLEASGAWALRFPDYRHLKFGGIIEGARWIWIEGVTEPLRLDAGDFYLLSHGGPYCFASDVKAKPVDGVAFMDAHVQPDGVVRFNGGEGRTIGTGGRFTFNDETSELLLTSLPPLIHIRGSLPQARALRAALELITFETEAVRAGRVAIGAGLCSIVLVNILRAYLAGDERPRGWLGALADRQIGAALRLMHGNVARRWKVGDLASEVGMSRTSFAERFKSLVGMAPLEYLTRWRMTVARAALRREDSNLATIAEAIGYESETAFSLAFKRMFGSSPGRYRIQMQRVGMAA